MAGDTLDLKQEEALLIKDAIAGNDLAFKQLFDRYYHKAYSLAFQIMRNHEDAEEVLQESFVKAYFALKNFQGNSSFYTWLYRIVRNMAIDVKRKLSIRLQAAPNESDENRLSSDGEHSALIQGPERILQNKQDIERLKQVLERIKPEQRQILIMREVDGLSYEEIAAQTRLNSGTVMSRLFYARKALESELEKFDQESEQLQKTELTDFN